MTEATWEQASGFEDRSTKSHRTVLRASSSIRPHVRNAFRPQTVNEMITRVRRRAREDQNVGVVILTGQGPEASALAVTRRCGAMPDTLAPITFPG